MRHILSNYFGFNKQQRNGLLVLVAISATLLLIRIVYPYFITPDPILIKNLPVYERMLDSAEKVRHATSARSKKITEVTRDVRLFEFDPNTVTEEELRQLGFSARTAAIFHKYRNKGFVFKKKEDLFKVYGVTEELYASVSPYVVIKATGKDHEAVQKTNQQLSIPVAEVTTTKIDLNNSDTLSLISLPGIGISYARRIIKYRELLGGYVSIDQVKEVYGMTDTQYHQIENKIFVGTVIPRKLNLNTDPFKTINKHPYISYELTKLIFDWRKKTVITAENFREIVSDPTLYSKILPYLSFD